MHRKTHPISSPRCNREEYRNTYKAGREVENTCQSEDLSNVEQLISRLYSAIGDLESNKECSKVGLRTQNVNIRSSGDILGEIGNVRQGSKEEEKDQKEAVKRQDMNHTGITKQNFIEDSKQKLDRVLRGYGSKHLCYTGVKSEKMTRLT